MTEQPLNINELHIHDDVDVNGLSHHHTLGKRAAQAATGNHRHLDDVSLWIDSSTSFVVLSNNPASPTVVNLDKALVDNINAAAATVVSDKFTTPVEGWYDLSGSVFFDDTAFGDGVTMVYVNAAINVDVVDFTVEPNIPTYSSITAEYGSYVSGSGGIGPIALSSKLVYLPKNAKIWLGAYCEQNDGGTVANVTTFPNWDDPAITTLLPAVGIGDIYLCVKYMGV